MSYTLVENRVSTPKKTGYTPVEQRISTPVSKTPIKLEQVNPYKEKLPFGYTNLGIGLNTLSGIPDATLKLGKDILQTTARQVASVGITAGNVPTQITNTIDGKTELPFEQEIPTVDSVITRVLFGGKPVKTIQKQTQDVRDFLKPYIGETGSSLTALPLVLGSIAIDLSGWGGKAGIRSFVKGEIPEAFLKFVAKEESPIVLESTLKQIGLNELKSKALAQQLAPTRTVDEVKDVLLNFEKNVNELKAISTASKAETSVDTLSSSIKSAKASGQSFDEWVKGQGETVYHGSPNGKRFDTFDAKKSAEGELGKGIFFSRDKKVAESYSEPRGEVYSWAEAVKNADVKEFGDKNFKILKTTRPEYSEMYKKAGNRKSLNESLKDKGYDGVEIIDEKQGIIFDNSVDKIKTRSQLKAEWDASNEKDTISTVDQLITDGKIRVVSREGKDIYQVKKSGKWTNTRDEESAIKQVSEKIKPELPQSIQEKQIELEIRKDALENNRAKELSKFVSKRGDFKGGLSEVTGKGKSRFSKSGDTNAMDAGFKDAEDARAQYDKYVTEKEYVKNLEQSIKTELKEIKSVSKVKTEKPTRIPKEEVASIEKQAEQSLSSIPEPVLPGVSSLKRIVLDTSTNVKDKVGRLDYFRTPDRVLKKIGLEEASKALRVGYDNYQKELPKHIQTITDWSKRVSKEGNQKIFKWLDGQDKVSLNGEELKVANEIKSYLREWADRLNLPDDNQITHYITHIFDIGEKQKEFDEEIASLIKNKVPGSVYDPFLEKRLGAKGYVEDTWRALDAYVKRAVRKSNMDPALEILKRDSEKLEDSQLRYVTRLAGHINMRPTDWDNELDNDIKTIIGYRFGQRPTAVISSQLRKMVYRGALGLNVSSAVKNLTQGVNTFSELGPKYTMIGYLNLLKPAMSAELEESGVLKSSFIQDRALSSTKKLLEKTDKALFAMFELAEKVNRGSAYFAAKSKAIGEGKSEIEAIDIAKQFVRDTQFVFGSIDTPLALQGDIAKTFLQFGSFPVKQTEFLIEMAKKKEYAGIVRYILASLFILYTVGEALNIKGKDFNPLNYFSRFGKPPSLALPLSVLKAVTNMPDQYGKTPTTKQKIKDIIYSGTTLVPGGVQISKLSKGQIIGGTKTKEKSKSVSGLPKLPKILPKLPKIK